MCRNQDIVLSVDYHLKNSQVRWLDRATGEERNLRIATDRAGIVALVDRACQEARAQGGKVVWIMESTTGWARVRELIGDRVEFLLCNVLQMPLPPKGHRRKTDKIDTGRTQREYLNGKLPTAYQPPRWLREVRRLVAVREDLVSRQTAVRNWISSYVSHETWESSTGLWSKAGRARLARLRREHAGLDGFSLKLRLAELEQLAQWLAQVETQMKEIYRKCPEAQELDRIRGIGPISAICIWARIGPVKRFKNSESLIEYAGLAPGVRDSDDTRRSGRLGGGGTDATLRRHMIEASIWARQIPRYQKAYERMCKRRGRKVGRLVVSRMLLRSIDKVLRDGVTFNPAA